MGIPPPPIVINIIPAKSNISKVILLLCGYYSQTVDLLVISCQLPAAHGADGQINRGYPRYHSRREKQPHPNRRPVVLRFGNGHLRGIRLHGSVCLRCRGFSRLLTAHGHNGFGNACAVLAYGINYGFALRMGGHAAALVNGSHALVAAGPYCAAAAGNGGILAYVHCNVCIGVGGSGRRLAWAARSAPAQQLAREC